MINYFSEAELFAHNDAAEKQECIDLHFNNMISTITLLNTVRHYVGFPLRVGSFFRNKEHNDRTAGSSPTSQHMSAGAMDVSPAGDNYISPIVLYNYCQKLAKNGTVEFGQVILYDTFVHISIPYYKDGKKVTNMFFSKAK